MARLEKWSLVGLGEQKPLAIRGEIFGDDRFADGTPITSSRLHFLDPAGHIASTRNHTYELATISPSFAQWMADQGKTIAGYALAVESARAAVRLQPMPVARPVPVAEPRRVAPVYSDATVLVQEPTRLVAAS